MTPRVWVTQRVEVLADRGERRDALDRRWIPFVRAAGALAVPVPNDLDWVMAMLAHETPAALLLSGGNSLVSCGGDAPERDELENRLLDFSAERNIPVLAVCRGMQLLLERCGARLTAVGGHVAAEQVITIAGERAQVNSYHDHGAHEAPPDLEVWATADDGVLKAVRHRREPWTGIMWHPERLFPFRKADVQLLAASLAGGERK